MYVVPCIRILHMFMFAFFKYVGPRSHKYHLPNAWVFSSSSLHLCSSQRFCKNLHIVIDTQSMYFFEHFLGCDPKDSGNFQWESMKRFNCKVYVFTQLACFNAGVKSLLTSPCLGGNSLHTFLLSHVCSRVLCVAKKRTDTNASSFSVRLSRRMGWIASAWP